MSSTLPLREKHERKAKDRAANEITKYFKPKRVMQIIAEERTVDEKAINSHSHNGKRATTKKKLDPSLKSESEAKRRRTPLTTIQPRDSKGSSIGQSSSSEEMEIVIERSGISINSTIVVNSTMGSVHEQSSFGFDDLHTDDPTDDSMCVDDDTFHRPYWSLYDNRIAIVIDQCKVSDKVIDTLFGAKEENVDLQDIFPGSKPLKRHRSTAVWNTPLRYSMLPKY